MSKNAWSMWYTEPTIGRVECKACRSSFAKKPARMLSHLGYVQENGSRDKGVARCNRMTNEVRTLFAKCGGKVPTAPRPEILDDLDTVASPVEYVEATERGTPSRTEVNSCAGPSQRVAPTSVQVEGTPIASAAQFSTGRVQSRVLRQSGLSEGFQESERRQLDKVWARFFYEANIPFAVARHPTFREAVKKTSDFHRGYTPPSYHDLRHKLLDEAKSELQTTLTAKMDDSIAKFGASLSMDGWNSVTNRPLCNAMLVTASGENFIASVDTTGKEKTAIYQAEIMEKFIEDVGPTNIVQVCTDNAKTMVSAGRMLTEKYPHIYFQGCAVHAMNLLLKDWGKIDWVLKIVKQAKAVVTFVKKRHMPQAVFRKYKPNLSLLMPADTRFACNFIMIDRLLKVKEELQQSVVDPQWTRYVEKLTDSGPVKAKTVADKVRKNILLDHFWNRCQNFHDMMGPVVWALKDFDSKSPVMGKILYIFQELEKHVKKLGREPFQLGRDVAKKAAKQFRKRWKMVSTDLHHAGALLNPYLLDDRKLAVNGKSITACKRVLRRLCPPGKYPDVLEEFLAFRDRRAPFNDMWDTKELKCSAHAWWDFEGACGELLAPIARRILAQTVSSSACERNWSSYSFVHNKVRNRLLPKRAEDLVYVYTNSKLMINKKQKNEKKWYEDNDYLEDSDSPSSAEAENIADDSGADASSEGSEAEDELSDSFDNSLEDEGENVERATRDVYEFDSDDEGNSSDVPIARFMNGAGNLRSENILRVVMQVQDGRNEDAEGKTVIHEEKDAEVALNIENESTEPMHETNIDREGDLLEENDIVQNGEKMAQRSNHDSILKNSSPRSKEDEELHDPDVRGTPNHIQAEEKKGHGTQSLGSGMSHRALFSKLQNTTPEPSKFGKSLVALSKSRYGRDELGNDSMNSSDGEMTLKAAKESMQKGGHLGDSGVGIGSSKADIRTLSSIGRMEAKGKVKVEETREDRKKKNKRQKMAPFAISPPDSPKASNMKVSEKQLKSKPSKDKVGAKRKATTKSKTLRKSSGKQRTRVKKTNKIIKKSSTSKDEDKEAKEEDDLNSSSDEDFETSNADESSGAEVPSDSDFILSEERPRRGDE